MKAKSKQEKIELKEEKIVLVDPVVKDRLEEYRSALISRLESQGAKNQKSSVWKFDFSDSFIRNDGIAGSYYDRTFVSDILEIDVRTLIFEHGWYSGGAPELVNAYNKLKAIDKLIGRVMLTYSYEIPEVICTKEELFRLFSLLEIKPFFTEDSYPDLCILGSPKCIVHDKDIFKDTRLHLWLGIFEPRRPGEFNELYAKL